MGEQGPREELIQRPTFDIHGDELEVKGKKTVREEMGVRKRRGARKSYEVNELVWAKSKLMPCMPRWPGIVVKTYTNWAQEVSGVDLEYLGQTPKLKVCLVHDYKRESPHGVHKLFEYHCYTCDKWKKWTSLSL